MRVSPPVGSDCFSARSRVQLFFFFFARCLTHHPSQAGKTITCPNFFGEIYSDCAMYYRKHYSVGSVETGKLNSTDHRMAIFPSSSVPAQHTGIDSSSPVQCIWSRTRQRNFLCSRMDRGRNGNRKNLPGAGVTGCKIILGFRCGTSIHPISPDQNPIKIRLPQVPPPVKFRPQGKPCTCSDAHRRCSRRVGELYHDRSSEIRVSITKLRRKMFF